MVLSAKHFGCHVPWSTRCINAILRLISLSDTKIDNSKVPVFFEKHVLWLNISMNNVLMMQIVQCKTHLCNYESYY